MTIDNKLLKLKNITPLQKLILGLILDTPPIVIQFAGGYNSTCVDIAKEIGSTRTKVRKEVDTLLEQGYISSKVGYRTRVTNISKAFIELLNS
ncbi:winged helix-turn-helix transcriptional regulator [Psychroserpens luteus]|uniref:MarR family protein n=1 Tax=Psychroserpens luteus TaxID=1434066 RepID=A0ABW5ZYS3_9FLAO|nr:winged helix-turn-helix transcriptional regulator [Psychroserpens luteus]